MEAAGPVRKSGGGGRLLDRVVRGLNGLGTLWILALLILINADIFGRNVLTAPISGVIEMIELSMVAIVFLQLGDATRVGRLTRSDGIHGIILRRAPGVGLLMAAAFDILGALFMFFILYGSWPFLVEAVEGGHYVGNEGVFTAPTWPVKLILVIGCAVTMLLFSGFVVRHLRAFRDAAEGPSR